MKIKNIKKALRMTSQLVIFRAFFRPPTINLKKIPVNQLIKKSGLIGILGTSR